MRIKERRRVGVRLRLVRTTEKGWQRPSVASNVNGRNGPNTSPMPTEHPTSKAAARRRPDPGIYPLALTLEYLIRTLFRFMFVSPDYVPPFCPSG